MKSVEVTHVAKSFGKNQAVVDVSFEVRPGEIFGLLGPNGAGKTTTVEIIEGLRPADSGTVSVLGMDITREVRAIKERVGIQPQHPALFPTLSVAEIIRFFRSLYKKTIPTDKVIDMVSLQESRKVLVKNLSGGQQQRLSVALAFVNDPEIIFLDEPTTGLDPQARRVMWEVIESLRRAGKTVFLTTHYMEEAERLCDRVAIMDHGQIIALNSPQRLIEEHIRESAIQFKMGNDPGQEVLESLSAVIRVVREADDIILYTGDIPATIAALLEMAAARSSELSELAIRQATLEDVFLNLTGKRIRD